MLLLILAMCSEISVASAYCHACLDGTCYSKTTLISGVNITDQLAIDRMNNILYVQIDSEIITAIYIKDNFISKMKVVTVFKTTGLSVDPQTGELCTTDFKRNVYKIRLTSNSSNTFNGLIDGVADLLCYESRLYYTKKNKKGLYFVARDETPAKVFDLSNFTITDFVKTPKGIVFVSNNSVYFYKEPFDKRPKRIVDKNMVLSTDRYDGIFLGDASQKVIYRKDNLSDKLVTYAAYQTGMVDKFVFDQFNNVIVYDATERTLHYWKRQKFKCGIEPPRCCYNVNTFYEFGLKFTDDKTNNNQITSVGYS